MSKKIVALVFLLVAVSLTIASIWLILRSIEIANNVKVDINSINKIMISGYYMLLGIILLVIACIFYYLTLEIVLSCYIVGDYIECDFTHVFIYKHLKQ